MPEIRIELIAIGDELLMGQTLDTNSNWIARRLADSGMRLQRLIWSSDEVEEIEKQIGSSWERSDVLIITGGLGPTHDDVTRAAIASFFDVRLAFREDLAENIRVRFRRRGVTPAPGWESMAQFPAGGHPIPNQHGAAPGIHFERRGKALYVLPGVPVEMRGMFDEYVLPLVQRKRTGAYRFVVIRTMGIGESHLAELIGDPEKLNPVKLAFLPSIEHGVTLRLSCYDENGTEVRAQLVRATAAVMKEIKPYVYAQEDAPIEAAILDIMRSRRLKLATAESCTGGMISARLTAIPGSSAVFERGFVTYSNRSKHDILGVQIETLERYGAVSEQTAQEMAEGARKAAKADIAISVTGIAGPDGGTEEKPVGLVFIGLADGGGTEVVRHLYAGDRDDNRKRATSAALTLLYQRVSKS